MVTTAARGSSDHAATFFKYLFEITCGVPVASVGPSIASVYGASLHLKGGIHFTVSQSGASPDIVALQDAAKRGGATTIAVVNVTDSPLAKQADIVLGLNAGAEKSVAATKSFIASVAALSGVTAAISGKRDLHAALEKLPEALQATSGIDTTGRRGRPFQRQLALYGRSRPRFRHCARGSTESQGDRRPARGGLLARRTDAWADASRSAGLPDRRLYAG